MNDDLVRDEPLAHLVDALREPVPLLPDLGHRARRRARRIRSRRLAAGGGLLTLVAVAVALSQFRTSRTTVTFAITAPAVQSVALVGDFTEWRADRVQLHQDSSGHWQTTLALAPGRYRFAYVVDRAEWRADSSAAAAPDDFGRPTSVLTVAGK